LIVLSHGPQERNSNAAAQWEETWQALQAELAALSSDSELRVIEDASHMIQVDRPDAVTDAILDVVARVRL
jgi:pimeloyl-ACP methyl ester carboxylesterase